MHGVNSGFEIGHFKSFKDAYRHLLGDRVPSLVARLFRSVTRESGVIIGYGGEEFLAVLSSASRADIRDVAG
jgi:diguanylate cyclase (GGDEF)-like protein